MRVSYLAGTMLPALILILLSKSFAAPPDHSNSGGNDPLDEILGRLDAIDSELEEIKKEVVHCTARARSRGECDRVVESQISAKMAHRGRGQGRGRCCLDIGPRRKNHPQRKDACWPGADGLRPGSKLWRGRQNRGLHGYTD